MMTTSLDREQLLGLLKVMLLIRRCEEQLARAHQKGLVHTGFFFNVGPRFQGGS